MARDAISLSGKVIVRMFSLVQKKNKMFSEKFRCYSFNDLKCSSNELVLEELR